MVSIAAFFRRSLARFRHCQWTRNPLVSITALPSLTRKHADEQAGKYGRMKVIIMKPPVESGCLAGEIRRQFGYVASQPTQLTYIMPISRDYITQII